MSSPSETVADCRSITRPYAKNVRLQEASGLLYPFPRKWLGGVCATSLFCGRSKLLRFIVVHLSIPKRCESVLVIKALITSHAAEYP